jgi:hypothetical protein
MEIVAPETSNRARQSESERINVQQAHFGKNPSSKGSMREPTQRAAAAGNREELKQALHDLEERKGDWSKGG